MPNAKQFFQDNVERHATDPARPVEYNEQRGFLALAEAIERVESRQQRIEQAQAALLQELRSLSGRIERG